MSADRSTCVFDCANVVVANQSFRQHAAHSVRMRDASCTHMRHGLLHSPSLPAATDATVWLLLMRPSPPSVGAILCRFARCGQSHAKWSPADAINTARCAVSPWRTVHRCGMPRLQPRSRWDDECLAANRLCVFCKADPHSRALLRRTSSRPPYTPIPPASSTLTKPRPSRPTDSGPSAFDRSAAFASKPVRLLHQCAQCILCCRTLRPRSVPCRMARPLRLSCCLRTPSDAYPAKAQHRTARSSPAMRGCAASCASAPCRLGLNLQCQPCRRTGRCSAHRQGRLRRTPSRHSGACRRRRLGERCGSQNCDFHTQRSRCDRQMQLPRAAQHSAVQRSAAQRCGPHSAAEL